MMSNCRPISNLSLLSKIIKHVVNLSSNKVIILLILTSLLTVKKHHSTETALLYIHQRYGHTTIMSLPSRPRYCFRRCWSQHLFSWLSSWFRIHDTDLEWFESYLSSRSFPVVCTGCFSSSHRPTCLCTARLCFLARITFHHAYYRLSTRTFSSHYL